MSITTQPLTWPDRTGLPHASKVAAIKALCEQSRATNGGRGRSQLLTWPDSADFDAADVAANADAVDAEVLQ